MEILYKKALGVLYLDSSKTLSFELWAKSNPYHPLDRHMIDTGCMARALLTDSCFAFLLPRLAKEFNITEDQVLQYIGFLFSLHDLGKCHPLFQQQCKFLEVVTILGLQGKLQEAEQSIYRHETLSAKIVKELLRNDGNSRPVARLWAEIIAMHHQRNQTAVVPIDPRIRGFWSEILEDLQVKMREVFLSATHSKMTLDDRRFTTGYLLLGLLVLSDWLASGPMWFTYGKDGASIEDYVETSKRSAIRAIKKLGFKKNPVLGLRNDFNHIWPNISRQDMRPLQTTCESFYKKVPSSGLLIIEAPMGEGKTEAAVYAGMQWIATFKLTGMYIALPTAATSNQMFDRISEFLEQQGMEKHIRLLHGMAWLLDEDTPEVAVFSAEQDSDVDTAWFRSSRKGLLSPWAVGTVDQAMLAALKVRFGALRLLGIMGKVLVIDEVHAYDVYMTVILERLLNWCGALDIPVILLSATLPTSRSNALLEAYTRQKISLIQKGQLYPILTYASTGKENIQQIVYDSYIKRRVKLNLWQGGLGKWDEVADKALSIVADSGCLCIIVNTVKEAQNLYTILMKKSPADLELMLFHGRFTAGERQRIERLCLDAFDKRSITSLPNSRPRKAVVVATQVVEQSLDLDFDFMISAIAPIDLLLQRTGRLHRHNDRVRPEILQDPQVLVLLPDGASFGPTEKVYDRWILIKTMEAINAKEFLDIPADLRQLIEFVYDDTPPPLDHPHRRDWIKMCQKRRDHEQEARRFLIPAPQDVSSILEEHWYEDEEGSNEWFHASTRLGRNTIQVLLLELDELERLLPNMDILTRSEARRLMLGLVALPSWWFNGLVRLDGSSPIVKGKGWLKGLNLLGLQNSTLIGFRGTGQQFSLVNDPHLGIYYKEVNDIGDL